MTTPPGPARKFGSRRWELAVASAGVLSRAEKAFLFGALPFLDWETGQTSASMKTIAAAAGYRLRAMQTAATRLAERGIVAFPSGRKGGLGPNRAGIPNRMKVSLAALERLKGAPRAPLSPAADAPLRGAKESAKGRTPRPEGAHSATGKGAPHAHNQLQSSTEEPTTTTKARGAEQAAGSAAQAAEPGCGGGGGGSSSLRGGKGSDQDSPVTVGPPTGLPHDAAASRDRLIEFGVLATKARSLSQKYSLGVVDAGIKWVEKNSNENTQSKPALLVTALDDGTASAAWLKAEGRRRQAETEQAACEARAMDARRCEAVNAVFRHLLENAATRDECQRRMSLLTARWPKPEDLIRAAVIPDELLLANPIDATAVVEAACAALEKLNNSESERTSP